MLSRIEYCPSRSPTMIKAIIIAVSLIPLGLEIRAHHQRRLTDIHKSPQSNLLDDAA